VTTICAPIDPGAAVQSGSHRGAQGTCSSTGDQLALDELTPIVYKIWLHRELSAETDDGLGSLETAR
jgi:hypothetical protein